MMSVATPVASPNLGLSRAEPVPLGKSVTAGPLELRVRDVLVGADAVAAILAASTMNAEPREGLTYVAVKLSVRNAGPQQLWLDNDDFALTGDSGLVYRYLGVQPPDPPLDVELAPGESRDGWLAFAVPTDERSLLLLFDSLSSGGPWADRVLAVQQGARIPDREERVAPPNSSGVDPAAPLPGGEDAVTDGWSATFLDVVSGSAAFDLVDYRTGALGAGDAAGDDGSVWIALRFHIQNVQAGGQLAYFPANAFALVDDAGQPLPDIVTLTPPWPDAAGGYFPGARRDGWVMFDVPVGYVTNVVRLQPFAHTTPSLDPRYFRFG